MEAFLREHPSYDLAFVAILVASFGFRQFF